MSLVSLRARTLLVRLVAALVGLAFVGGIVACGDGDTSGGSGDPSGVTGTGGEPIFGTSEYPVTVHTGAGEVTIDERPSRIVSTDETATAVLREFNMPVVGISDTSHLSAFGVSLPWLAEDVKEGGDLFDDKLMTGPYETSAEQVSTYEPDLIFVGAFEKNTEKLSRIAPVIQRDKNEIDSVALILQALGRTEEEIEAYRSNIDKIIDPVVDGEWSKGKSFSVIAAASGKISVTPESGNAWLNLERLGLSKSIPPSMPKEGARELSAENVRELGADLLIVLNQREIASPILEGNTQWRELGAVRNGRVFYSKDAEWDEALDAPIYTSAGAEYFSHSEIVAKIRESLS